MSWGVRIEDLDLIKLKDYSIKLAEKVRENEYMPDHVLYVERVGLFVGYEIAKYFDCSISGIYSSRSGTSLKSKTKSFLRYLPRTITHQLRKIEFKSKFHEINKDRNVYVQKAYPPRGKKILIVDDAIDTGHSLKAVLDFLIKKGYDRDQIKIAVLITTQNNPILCADISLFDKVSFAFPWSYDSKEYDVAWKLYDELKASI